MEFWSETVLQERRPHVPCVERRDISGRTVESGWITAGRDPEAAVSDPADLGELMDSSRNVSAEIEINVDEKLVVDEAEKRLDELEGVIVEEKEDVCLIFEEEEDLDNKVHDTLARHARFWRDSGATDFAVSVVENGYVPQMWENPQNYEEKNNGSYREEKVWANEAVFKLAKAKLVREVDRWSLCCVNPLTVAKNARGKKRLCLDLSRCVNGVVKAPKFRIESTFCSSASYREGGLLLQF